MTFTSGDTHKRCVQLLTSYAAITIIMCVMAGCRTQANPTPGMATGRIPDKESYLLAKLQTRYQNPDTHCELGRYYLNQGLFDKAKYHLERALGFRASHRPAQAAYVRLTAKLQGEMASQRLCAEYERQILSSTTEMLELAKALGEEGLDTLALNCFQKVLTVHPESAEANRQLAYFYLARKDNEKAKLYFSKSFQLNSNQPDVAGELGRLGITIQTPKRAPEPPADY